MAQQGQLGTCRRHLGIGRIDFLTACALLHQGQCILPLLHGGLRHPGRTARPVHILHAHRAGTGRCNPLQPRLLTAGTLGIRLGSRQPAACLGDLGRPCTVLQPPQVLFLHPQLGRRLIRLQRQRARVQHRQHLARLHPVAFLRVHLCHTPAALEGQRHLPHVDVAVENAGLPPLRAPVLPAVPARHRHGSQQHDHHDGFLHERIPGRTVGHLVEPILS